MNRRDIAEPTVYATLSPPFSDKEELDQINLNPPLSVETYEVPVASRFRVNVIRDDFLEGGTKQRGIDSLIQSHPAIEYVYAGPVCGFAQVTLFFFVYYPHTSIYDFFFFFVFTNQVALAYVCYILNKKATVVISRQQNGQLHPLTVRARYWGAKVVEMKNVTPLKVLHQRAREYTSEQNIQHPGMWGSLQFIFSIRTNILTTK
jgi:hypothetical protein